MNRTAFDTYHPAVAALYLAAVLVFVMAAFQPVFVAMGLAVGVAYNAFLRGWRATAKTLAWQIPLLLVVAVLNLVFSASGSTILWRMGHRAFYLESLQYGLFMGLMLVSMMQWFSNLSHVLTSDKIMQLTGSRLPTIGLMITMILRLVPQFLRRGVAVRSVQEVCTSARAVAADGGAGVGAGAGAGACAGAGAGTRAGAGGMGAPAGVGGVQEGRGTRRGVFARTADAARSYVRDLSVLMGWGLEDSLDTAEAMRARGWGATRTRSTYRRSEFRLRDGIVLAAMCVLLAASAFLAVVACSQFAFYPRMSRLVLWWGYGPYLLFLLVPFILELKERFVWRR